ncbi:MAG: polyprenyl synthetase family protein [Phycisphaerae bacterium]|nr:polyprenyl synthetase family protein [Phycisphaerae bacterium]
MPALDCFSPMPVIESALHDRIASRDLPAGLAEALRYALLGGGKRIRPLLAWHACVAAGAPGERSLPAGVAVEFVHAFSLVHDDLPALDNDDVRRGRPTLHRHAGEAMAILAGDALLALAFDVLSREPPPALGQALCAELTAGTSAMIVGQVYDTLGGLPHEIAGAERVRLVHRNKTGALMRAACRMGALLGGVGAGPRLGAITAFGDAVGLMFQVVDDLIDVEQPADHAGKRTGKDSVAGKLTFPGVLGVEGSRAEVERLEREALAAVAGLGPSSGGLADLCRAMSSRTR